jgi:oligopeptide transport system permease protein
VATVTASQRRAAELNVIVRKQRSLWLDAFERLRRNRAAMVSLFIIAFFALLAIFAPLLPLHDPHNYFYEGRSGPTLKDPVWMPDSDPRFLLGTDQIGRDVLSRLVWSARVSMVVGLIPVSVIFLVGTTVGLIAGYFGGWVDTVLMRITDVIYAFPDLLLLVIVMATLGQTEPGRAFARLPLIFLALAVVNWVGMARLVRGQVLSLKEKEFVEAARAVGAGPGRIMVRHLFPNALAPVIVAVAFGIPSAILAEAVLSFIGIGIIPPTPSWGVMIHEGFAVMFGTPFMVLLPAACVAIVMLAFTFVGDGLRDALDPRMKI